MVQEPFVALLSSLDEPQARPPLPLCLAHQGKTAPRLGSALSRHLSAVRHDDDKEQLECGAQFRAAHQAAHKNLPPQASLCGFLLQERKTAHVK